MQTLVILSIYLSKIKSTISFDNFKTFKNNKYSKFNIPFNNLNSQENYYIFQQSGVIPSYNNKTKYVVM